MIISNLIERCKEQSARVQELSNLIAALPDGKLLCAQNGGNIKWYLSNGAKPKYLSKKEHALAEQLALKKYYELLQNELKEEIILLERLIRIRNSPKVKTSAKLLETPGYRELLGSYFTSSTEKFQHWMNDSYETNPRYTEYLVHPTLKGDKVRSKSEVIIANSLYQHGIPYRYECALYLDNVTCYPDFTILHPLTEKIHYWEHFGMMDNPSYRDKAFNKLKLLGNYDIIPSVNLITTYETQNTPIDSFEIERIVKDSFVG